MKKLRYEFRRWLDTIDVKNLVFIDETGLNLAMTRLYGRCQGGCRVYDDRPGNKGRNITLIGAMSVVSTPPAFWFSLRKYYCLGYGLGQLSLWIICLYITLQWLKP